MNDNRDIKNIKMNANRDGCSSVKMGLRASLVVRGLPPLANTGVATEILLWWLHYRCMRRLVRHVEEEWLGTVLVFQ